MGAVDRVSALRILLLCALASWTAFAQSPLLHTPYTTNLTTIGNGLVQSGTTLHFGQASAYSSGRIPFATGASTIGFDAGIVWDNSAKLFELVLGGFGPTITLHAATGDADFAGLTGKINALTVGANAGIFTNSLTLPFGTASTLLSLNGSKAATSIANAAGILTNNGSGGFGFTTNVTQDISFGSVTVSSLHANALLAGSGVFSNSLTVGGMPITGSDTVFTNDAGSIYPLAAATLLQIYNTNAGTKVRIQADNNQAAFDANTTNADAIIYSYLDRAVVVLQQSQSPFRVFTLLDPGLDYAQVPYYFNTLTNVGSSSTHSEWANNDTNIASLFGNGDLTIKGQLTLDGGGVTINGIGAFTMQMYDGDGTNTLTLNTPQTIPTSYTLALPATNGTSGQALFTDGNTNLYWGSAGASASSLSVNTTAVGNIGTGEDNLMTLSVAGDTLSADGNYLEGRASGSFAANTNNKQVKAYFGATQIFATGAVAFNAGDWTLDVQVIRTGATAQIANATWHHSSGSFVSVVTLVSTPAETLSGDVTFKLTGEATANNDIVQKTLTMRHY